MSDPFSSDYETLVNIIVGVIIVILLGVASYLRITPSPCPSCGVGELRFNIKKRRFTCLECGWYSDRKDEGEK